MLFRKEVSEELQRDFGIWIRRILRTRNVTFDISAREERSVSPMIEETLERAR
jgi:hypothetical protein